ncbi:hypothetical protein COLO4_32312 [Corchorus olitorius]|uniref:Protein kinase domain-containing protein n=1 Tax=Corchorus olitorius TaxID=93759 RepID=A0A1R3GZN1_9ROSI|nr:hypothetical protein COLO4_32312 [Corchorus olitorius]
MTGNEVSPSSSDQKLTLDSQVPVHMSSSAASGPEWLLIPARRSILMKVVAQEEVKILNHPSLKHPNLVKMMGACYEKNVKAVIYDLYPLDTLHNYMSRGGHGHARVYHDVYSFGLVLVELITKRITSEDEIILKGVKPTRDWVKEEHKPGYSLVCQSLRNQSGYDPSDGLMITELAMDCINDAPPERPTIETVVERLENLSVVKSHADFHKN